MIQPRRFPLKSLIIIILLLFILAITIGCSQNLFSRYYALISTKPSSTTPPVISLPLPTSNSTAEVDLPKLLIAVLSSSGPKYTDLRRMIRETWGTDVPFLKYRYDVELRFFICVSSDPLINLLQQEENAQYQDLFIFNFTDDYYTIWRKTWGIMKHANEDLDVDYVLKVDDDTYIDLIKFMENAEPSLSPDIVAGWIMDNAGPERDPENKWFVSEEEFTPSKFPPYPMGWAYLLGRNVVNFISEEGERLIHFKIDDVGVGMWIAEGSQEDRIHPDFVNLKNMSLRCTRFEGLIAANMGSEGRVRCTWDMLHKIENSESHLNCCEF